jgi:hypothetical protein
MPTVRLAPAHAPSGLSADKWAAIGRPAATSAAGSLRPSGRGQRDEEHDQAHRLFQDVPQYR